MTAKGNRSAGGGTTGAGGAANDRTAKVVAGRARVVGRPRKLGRRRVTGDGPQALPRQSGRGWRWHSVVGGAWRRLRVLASARNALNLGATKLRARLFGVTVKPCAVVRADRLHRLQRVSIAGNAKTLWRRGRSR